MPLRVLALALLLCALPLAAQTHADTGLIVEVHPNDRTIVVSCAEILNSMAAMEMSFKVRNPSDLKILKTGMQIRFNIVPAGPVLYAEHIQPQAAENFESEPMQAGALTALSSALSPATPANLLKIGDLVPDFTLIDQVGHAIHLALFRGKVVALTFGYSRCPNPDYCLRLSNNLGAVERRFQDRAGRDLILLTIAIDPEHDHGEALTRYAEAFHADPAKWHFVTGSVPQVHQVAGLFGMNFWRDEGLLTHSLHTVLINCKGELAANLEGNRFTAQQLGDLVKSELRTCIDTAQEHAGCSNCR